jgi:hypothetical protein
MHISTHFKPAANAEYCLSVSGLADNISGPAAKIYFYYIETGRLEFKLKIFFIIIIPCKMIKM